MSMYARTSFRHRLPVWVSKQINRTCTNIPLYAASDRNLVLSRTYAFNFFPEGLPGSLENQLKYSGRVFVARRDIDREIMDHMDDVEQNPDKSPSEAYFIHGPRGIGKSSVLTSTIHHARSNGWIALQIPSALTFMFDGEYVAPSIFYPGYFDTPLVSNVLLHSFYNVHQHQLENIPIKDHTNLDRFAKKIPSILRLCAQLDDEPALPVYQVYFEEIINNRDNLIREPKNLAELVKMGYQFPQLSSSILRKVRSELSMCTEYPVLIAVDGYNHLFRPSQFFYNYQRLYGHELTVPSSFMDLVGFEGHPIEQSLAWGFVIVADSHKLTLKNQNLRFKPNRLKHVKLDPLPFQEASEMLTFHSIVQKRIRELSIIEDSFAQYQHAHFEAAQRPKPSTIYPKSRKTYTIALPSFDEFLPQDISGQTKEDIQSNLITGRGLSRDKSSHSFTPNSSHHDPFDDEKDIDFSTFEIDSDIVFNLEDFDIEAQPDRILTTTACIPGYIFAHAHFRQTPSF